MTSRDSPSPSAESPRTLRGRLDLVRHSTLKGATRAIATAFTAYTDTLGFAYPSIGTLAADAGVCERTARYAVRSLELVGVLRASGSRRGGRRRTTGYFVDWNRLRALARSVEPGAMEGGNGCQKGGNGCPRTSKHEQGESEAEGNDGDGTKAVEEPRTTEADQRHGLGLLLDAGVHARVAARLAEVRTPTAILDAIRAATERRKTERVSTIPGLIVHLLDPRREIAGARRRGAPRSGSPADESGWYAAIKRQEANVRAGRPRPAGNGEEGMAYDAAVERVNRERAMETLRVASVGHAATMARADGPNPVPTPSSPPDAAVAPAEPIP